MKTKIILQYLYKLAFLGVIIISGCNFYDEPEDINNSNKTYPSSPAITRIVPESNAIAGVREIIIEGQNFAVDNPNDTVWVYIGGRPAIIKSITQDKITVYRPASFGEGLAVDVVKHDATSLAQYKNYNIEVPIAQFGDFRLIHTYPLYSIEIDKDENIFVGGHGKIFKQSTDGLYITEWADLSPSTFNKITDLRFGPGGYLYAANDKRDIYRFNPTAEDTVERGIEKYVNIPKNTAVIDFDASGNLYAARRDGIFIVMNGTKEIKETGHYDGLQIDQIRVVSDYVYTLSAKKISKNRINGDGTLGADETVLDLSAHQDFTNYQLSSFNISEDGILYLCITGHPDYSLFIVENDGTIAPYYTDNIIPRSIDQIIWGSGRYIYLNRGLTLPKDSTRVYRMGMDRNGARYPGRY